MKRVAGYVRVSTQEQKAHGLSVDSQIVALKDYCKSNEYELVEIYNDAGISARKKYTSRPALLKLIEDVKQGKIDLIIFTKLDRWFRSVADYYEVQKVLDDYNIPWRAIWEDYETETSSGVFKVNIMLSVAQSEADRTSERIKAVNEYKRARGDFVGNAPLGYKIVNKQLVVDEETKEAVEVFFRTYLTSRTSAKAMQEIEKYGIKMSYQRAGFMLSCPAYTGDYRGYKTYQYITQEEYDSIQIVKAGKRVRFCTRKNRFYLFTGIIKCGCCKSNLKGIYRRYPYKDKNYYYKIYACQRHNNKYDCNMSYYPSETVIEKYLLKNLDSLLSDYKLEIETENAKHSHSVSEVKKLEQKLKRIGIRFEDGDYTVDEYKKKKAEIQHRISELKIPVVSCDIKLPDNWKEVYKDLDDEHKKAFWLNTVREIRLFKDHHIEVDFL